MLPSLQLTLISVSELFPQAYTHTMPGAPAETTVFPGAVGAVSELSEPSYKSV